MKVAAFEINRKFATTEKDSTAREGDQIGHANVVYEADVRRTGRRARLR